jgi:hypothetical protein
MDESYRADALDLLARLLEAAETAGWTGKAIEILALQAMALQAQGDTTRRWSHWNEPLRWPNSRAFGILPPI